MKTALTIAGSDSSGGAGIQADIKTMCANHVFATSAITALTAQNTLGVTGIMEVTPKFLGEQLDAVFTDIYPDAVKIGMVSSSDLIRMIASKLQEYKAANIVAPQLSNLPSAAPSFVRSPTSGISDSHGVTGGVYKTRERIHRSILICDY